MSVNRPINKFLSLRRLPNRLAFLVADTELYKRLCPSVRPLVGWSVGRLVRHTRVEKWKNEYFPPLPTRPQPKAVYPALFPLLSLLLLILHIRLDTSIHQAFVLAIYMVQISHIFLSFYVDFFTQFIHLPICTRQKWVIQTGTQKMKLVQTTILTRSAFVTMTRIE